MVDASRYGVEAARRRRLGDPLHREPVRGRPHPRREALRGGPGLLERARHDVVELRVDLVLLPEVLLEPLDPLEVRDDHAAGVREHVGEHEDPAVLEDLVRGGRRRAVRRLADHVRADARRVLGVDHLLERRRASTSHSSSISSSFVASSVPGSPASTPCSDLCATAAGTSMPYLFTTAPFESDSATTSRALLGQQPREVAPDVAEALDRDPGVREAASLLLQRGADAVEDAARGRLVPADRAADRERLAGDDAEHGVADVHRVRVEDPGHHLRVRADVGRGDVLLRPDLVDDLGRVAARVSRSSSPSRGSSGRRRRRPSRRRTGGP